MTRDPFEHTGMTNRYHTVRFTKKKLVFHDFSSFFCHFWSKKGGLFSENDFAAATKNRKWKF